uniref:Integrase, catalytic region, zinc finger, CCHC-type, peptidase aspartic, catalytic n=1 Tax=Tanacetum cinerariifolium TaxID=118510 RepID=A0A6L2KHE0_TANCI|nr:hypothetical protein [Tanacetum cinerariifolium]
MMSEDSSAASTQWASYDNIFETVSPSWPSEVPQDEHLDSDDDSVHEDYMIPYNQYLATKESQDVPTKASPIPPTAAYMLQMLTNLTTQVEGHRKVNQEHALVNATLSAKLDQCLGLSNPWFGRKAQLSQPTLYDGHRLLQPGHAHIMVSDSHETLLETEFVPQKELSREQVYWLSASDIASQSSDPPKPVTPFVYTRPVNSELQEQDETIRNLESQFNISQMLKIGSPVGILDKNALETKITQLKDNITSLRIQNDGYKSKLQTIADGIMNCRNGSGTKVSGPKTPEKPKVLALGMYAISYKYITPPRRGDWAPPTPRKKHVTFQEPHRVSTTYTKHQLLITIKNLTLIVLPTKNKSARRVEDHPRNLNERKNVNSSLNDKRFGSVKNDVCDACNKCSVSFTHDKCYVRFVNTMHAKKPQVARLKTIPKNVRKTDITVAYRIVPQWKPTGQQFILCDIYGLKKSKEPTAKHLELSPSVSSSSPINVISRFSDFQLSDRKAYSKGISDLNE